MTRYFTATRISAAVVAFFLLGACYLPGRVFASTCQYVVNPLWETYIDLQVSPQVQCPIGVPAGGTGMNYSATVRGPNAHVDQAYTYIYANDHSSIRGAHTDIFYYEDSYWARANLSIYYLAGRDAGYGLPATDYAETTVPLDYTYDAIADVELTYRAGILADLSGPLAPAPGTNATWSVNVRNAPTPYTYRWFQDGSELSTQTQASITLPVATQAFNLKVIANASDGSADTLSQDIVPQWSLSINGLTNVAPNVPGCGYTVDTGNGTGPFTFHWGLDGAQLSDDTQSIYPRLALGSHTLVALVTDGNGYSSKAYIVINVTTDGPQNCL